MDALAMNPYPLAKPTDSLHPGTERNEPMSPDVIEAPIPEIYTRTSTGRPATDLVMTHILDGLLDKKFESGQRLNAKSIAEELDVSIVPVREAMHFLAGEGIVELMPLKGARIRKMNREETVDWWHVFCAIGNVGIRAASRELLRAPEKAVLVAEAQDRIDAAQGTLASERFIMTLLDFHRVLNDICNRPVLDEAVRRLQVVFWCSFLPDYVPFETYGVLFASHYRNVAEAIMRGDGETAVSAFKYHVAWSSAIMHGARPEPGKPWQDKDEYF